MRFEKNKADCHFIYEGRDVNVKGVVNEDLGNLDPLSVTFSFNVPPENRKKDTNVEEEGNEDSTSDHQGARCSKYTKAKLINNGNSQIFQD
ncbi:unnamed protein product [Darwinula stevensoni]|uniref:Uncharacterized protein n=1 Tax=Darwinula stevensoni TaxID=69355 RepID=A0A7R9A290_9CRUS|nr:unnamed protein product [Darwinula stevensoni]CAG0885204.1 unnamed protein product [Darwinula stevensoni]